MRVVGRCDTLKGMDANPSASTAFLVLLSLLVAYFAPTIIAHVRHHPSSLAITILNSFAGWTLIGWAWTLVWSLLPKPKPEPLRVTLEVTVRGEGGNISEKRNE